MKTTPELINALRELVRAEQALEKAVNDLDAQLPTSRDMDAIDKACDFVNAMVVDGLDWRDIGADQTAVMLKYIERN